jgi:hypothetical protein
MLYKVSQFLIDFGTAIEKEKSIRSPRIQVLKQEKRKC